MSIFGAQTQGPTRINQVQINQSVLGYPLPVVMGRGKVQQSILWADGFTSKLINASGGGKGFGGGKGGNQYVYGADVIGGLCAGPIAGIGDVWSGQSWLSNTTAAETYTITGGATYTPARAGSMTAPIGVGLNTAYSAAFGDAGASGPTALNGSHVVPFQRVRYGATLGSGQYSIDPSNVFHFSSADIGKTVQLYYSFDLTRIKRQDTVLIPAGRTVSVGGSLPFVADMGVVYYDPSGGPANGQAVTGYSVSGSGPATYTFAAGDVGKEVIITYALNNSSAIPQGTSSTLGFSVFEGYPGQTPWALLETNFPGADFGYTGVAYVAYAPMDLGYGAQIQQNVFEVLTADGWGAGIPDCNPVQCILQVLTNPTWGLGAGAVPFPLNAIDNGPSGTWGTPTPTGAARQGSTASNWFAANGFFISPVIDKQDSAASLIGRWLEAGQCAAYMSEGLLKLKPYGDTSTAGNGAIWVAPSEFIVALDDTCFIPQSEGEEPVKISSSPWQDAYNVVQVQWSNRANQYAPEITPESDQAARNRYGDRVEDPQTWDFITNLPAATFAASMRVKRNVYTRNTYEFSLSYRYSYLEPMDLVYITTSSQWAAGSNNQNLAINSLPVRITKIVDNPDGTLDITAEDYPFGAHSPTLYNKALAAGVSQPSRFADPGNSEVVLFEATDRLTGFRGNEIWLGATGANADWGGCNVLASMDGDTYKTIGTIKAPARIGVLGAGLPSGSDPDTANTLVIDLVENSEALDAGTSADADADNTLCYVGGELLSYSLCTVTGQDQYTANTYIRRGRMGSAIAAHSAGALVMRLDDNVFKYTYDPSWAGKTVHLKFQSFNVYGNSAQDPATLTAVDFTIPGQNPGTIDASTGLIIGLNSNSIPPNVPYNTGNTCSLTTLWDSNSGTATVDGYGPGGPGTDWQFLMGQGSMSYPAFSITGLPATTTYAVIFNTKVQTYSVQTAYAGTLPDYIIVIGSVTTASASSQGSGGGGGDVGTPPVRGGGGPGIYQPAQPNDPA